MPRARVRETEPNGRVAYTVKSLPIDERPRERLLKAGPDSLSDGELLAIILRTGLVGEMVTELSNDLLAQYGGFWGLAQASVAQLSQRRGLKGAKVAQVKAAIEIGRRMSTSGAEERAQVTSPDDAARLVQFGMAGLEQEEMWVILLDTSDTQCGCPEVGRLVTRFGRLTSDISAAPLMGDPWPIVGWTLAWVSANGRPTASV